MNCDHQFSYGGVRYYDGVNMQPDGAFRRYYAHVYFCIKCTECKGQPIGGDGHRPYWNSQGKLQFNATPGTPALCGVPLKDQ